MNEHDSSSPAGSPATAAGSGPEPAGRRPAPRLLRFPDEGPCAGVAAGLGAYFGVDPVFFRIAFLLLAFAGGSGVLLYGIGWLVIPAAAPGETAGQRAAPASDRTAQWVGIGLIVAAVFWLTGPFDLGGPVLWGLALAGVGILLFREDARRREREAQAGVPPAAGAPGTRAPGASPPSGAPVGAAPAGERLGATPAAPEAHGSEEPDAHGHEEPQEDDEETAILEEAARLREGVDLQGWSAGGWDPPASNWAPAPPPPAAPTRRRSFLGRATIGLTLVTVGILALADNLSPAVSVAPARYVALALTIIGAGLLVGAWLGRARGLIPVGLLLLPVLAAMSLFQFGAPWRGGVGERVWRPAELAEVRDEYSLGTGQLFLDLSDVDFGDAQRTVSADVGLGQVEVVVPDDVDVKVNASTGAGELDLLGESVRGNRLELTVDHAGPGDGSLTLDLDSGLGQITVSRVDE